MKKNEVIVLSDDSQEATISFSSSKKTNSNSKAFEEDDDIEFSPQKPKIISFQQTQSLKNTTTNQFKLNDNQLNQQKTNNNNSNSTKSSSTSSSSSTTTPTKTTTTTIKSQPTKILYQTNDFVAAQPMGSNNNGNYFSKTSKELFQTTETLKEKEKKLYDKSIVNKKYDQNEWKNNQQTSKNNGNVQQKQQQLSLRFTEEQLNLIALVSSGKSVFFSGCAGTGKSTILKWLISNLPREFTIITASTGVAAVNIGGITIHSFLGFIPNKQLTKDQLLRNLLGRQNALATWRKIKTLVIDEISMVDSEMFEMINYVARGARADPRPMGGIQLIVCGDFFQLPPVVSQADLQRRRNNENQLVGRFCFEAPSWPMIFDSMVELTQVFRQSDLEFVEMLNEVRYGKLSQQSEAMLEQCLSREFDSDDGIIPTRLYTHVADVDELNQQELLKLDGSYKRFISKDRGDQRYLDALDNACPAPQTLMLKLGAQVLLVKNIDTQSGLTNGSRGVIVDFDQVDSTPIVQFTNGLKVPIGLQKFSMEVGNVEVASREQIPLRCAWALTIHKVQGSTISRAEISLAKVFEFGQAYVALSRVSSLEGLKLLDFRKSAVRAHPKVVEFYEHFKEFRKGVRMSTTIVEEIIADQQQDDSAVNNNNNNNWTSTKRNDEQKQQNDPEFIVEYAKSARGTCKNCSSQIEKDSLRFGKIISSTKFNHTFPIWFHLDCFIAKVTTHSRFPEKPPTSLNQISGIQSVSTSDRQRILDAFGIQQPQQQQQDDGSFDEPVIITTTTTSSSTKTASSNNANKISSSTNNNNSPKKSSQSFVQQQKQQPPSDFNSSKKRSASFLSNTNNNNNNKNNFQNDGWDDFVGAHANNKKRKVQLTDIADDGQPLFQSASSIQIDNNTTNNTTNNIHTNNNSSPPPPPLISEDEFQKWEKQEELLQKQQSVLQELSSVEWNQLQQDRIVLPVGSSPSKFKQTTTTTTPSNSNTNTIVGTTNLINFFDASLQQQNPSPQKKKVPLLFNQWQTNEKQKDLWKSAMKK